jgi:urea transporter
MIFAALLLLAGLAVNSLAAAAYALMGTVLTVVVQGAMNVALAPFVLASWLFLLPGQKVGQD